MQERILRQADIQSFQKSLIAEEKSTATIEKYVRDATAFLRFAEGAEEHLCTAKRNERTGLCRCKREARNAIYAS